MLPRGTGGDLAAGAVSRSGLSRATARSMFWPSAGAALVQCTVVPVVGVGGIVPDVPVVLTVLLALRYGAEAGCLIGLRAGPRAGRRGRRPAGLHALSKALLGFVAGDLPRWVLVTRPIVPVGLAVLATIVDGLLRFALLQLFHYPAPLGEIFTPGHRSPGGVQRHPGRRALAWPAAGCCRADDPRPRAAPVAPAVPAAAPGLRAGHRVSPGRAPARESPDPERRAAGRALGPRTGSGSGRLRRPAGSCSTGRAAAGREPAGVHAGGGAPGRRDLGAVVERLAQLLAVPGASSGIAWPASRPTRRGPSGSPGD